VALRPRYAARERNLSGTRTAAQWLRNKDYQRMKYLVVFLVAIILVLIGFTWFTLHWSYSDGERAGFLQKFSRKGWVCKTWEGEMALVTLPGTMAEKFAFTVHDDDVAAKLSANIGKRMTLHYEQRKWIPTSCFGDTEYFVTGMQLAPELTQP
jgi:hypothetical protein